MFYQAWKKKALTVYHTIPFFNNADKEALKTLWEKEKMQVTSIFSFFHNVLYPFQNNFQFLGYVYFVVYKSFESRPV